MTNALSNGLSEEQKFIDAFRRNRANGVEEDRNGIKYSALDLIIGEYDFDRLADYALDKGQHLALGYLCDVIKDSLPSESDYIRKRFINLVNKLYESSSEWKYLSQGLSNWSRELVEENVGALNKKWHIYSNLSKEEMRDWFRVHQEEVSSVA